MQFLFPVDGDVLTPADGEVQGDALLIPVRLALPDDAEASVNGVPCRGGVAMVPLTEYRTLLTARSGAEQQEITVYRFRNAYKKYRLAIDDIIWTLREIAQKEYASIYDSAFFAFFRELYEEFGTKTHFNIYFSDGGAFDLTQFPDRYYQEFEDACAWMRLTFHARQDQPDRIYREAPYEEVYRDFWQVTDQIRRFAGDRIWRTGVNGLHFAETTREGSRALRDCGADCQVGYFIFDKKGRPAVSYYLDEEQTARMAQRDFWIDHSEKIIFSRDKLVLDQCPAAEIPERLDRMLAEQPCGMGTLNFVTHEQYFYPYFSHYLSDYRERVRAAVRWAQRHGYEPCFLSDYIYE